MRRRIPLGPAEGWLTLASVVLICLTMAWAIDDARWVLGNPDYLDLLAVAAVGGVLVGFIGPKVGWGRWLTFLIGAVFAALLVPLMVALVDFPGASIGELYRTTAASAVQAYVDIAVLGLSSTTQYLHFILVLTLLVWATSMFASYAVFGHHRPLSAVVAVGVILVADMSLAFPPQLSLPGPVQHRLASVADPVSRVRRTVGMGTASDRRSGEHLVGLPAGWGCFRHRRRGRGGLPHLYGGIGAPGRGVGRRGGWPDRDLAVRRALPADRWLDPTDRPGVRAEHADRAGVDDQRCAGGHDPQKPDRQRQLLLARMDLRQDRPEWLGPDDSDLRRRPG